MNKFAVGVAGATRFELMREKKFQANFEVGHLPPAHKARMGRDSGLPLTDPEASRACKLKVLLKSRLPQ